MKEVLIIDPIEGTYRKGQINWPAQVVDAEYLATPDGPIHLAYVIDPIHEKTLDLVLQHIRRRRKALKEEEAKLYYQTLPKMRLQYNRES